MAEYTIDKIEYDGNVYKLQDNDTTYVLSNALSSHKFTWTFTAGGSGSGSTTTTAELVAGTGITLTDDTTNKKITIASSIIAPTITLNGSTTTSPSFYAPTSAGTSGYVLVSNGNGAPTWAASSSIGVGSFKITLSYDSSSSSYLIDKTTSEINAAVTAGKWVYLYDGGVYTDLTYAIAPLTEKDENGYYFEYAQNGGSINYWYATDANEVIIDERAGRITINNTITTSASFYAPTTVGTNGQYLKSNGSGAPTWTNFPTIINTRGTPTSGGTTLSVVNTGDMYTWNNKSQAKIIRWTGTV